MTISIVLADDHPVVRRGIRALLEAEPGYAVVGEASDGLHLLRLAERLQPDVLLLDLMMPGLNGLDALPALRRRCPRTRVVVLSVHGDEAFVQRALKDGATGYALKDCDPDILMRAVREAAAGRRYLSPPLSERAVEAYVEKAHAAPPDPHETLTPREREVLQLAAEGYTGAETARRLSISPRTVEMHRGNLMHKLGLRTVADLIRYALRRGIIPLET
jgi:DNA-binding NarL/FixJ family response regulator